MDGETEWVGKGTRSLVASLSVQLGSQWPSAQSRE